MVVGRVVKVVDASVPAEVPVVILLVMVCVKMSSNCYIIPKLLVPRVHADRLPL